MSSTVVVCGGAGFIGSHICKAFVTAGWRVTAIDALYPETGGRREHLDRVAATLVIGDVAERHELLREADLVVDAMGWTAHAAGMADPKRDLARNLLPHIETVLALRESANARVIYLGSRHEYGRAAGVLDEAAPLTPGDVQSIHKAAADHHYRVAASASGLSAVSLRFGNTFGERQPMGPQAGLVGRFIEDLLDDRTVRVFQGKRTRSVIYAADLASIVVRLASVQTHGYVPLNVPGHELTVPELAELIHRAVGQGSWEEAPMPREVAATEVGEARLAGSALVGLIGAIELDPLDATLVRTVDDVRARRGEVAAR